MIKNINNNNIKFFETIVGSYNYNLNTPKSDIDKKVFIFPNFNSLYSSTIYSSFKASDIIDRDIKDIRSFPKLIYKSNPNYMEVLFSEFEINEKIKDWKFALDYIDYLKTNKERLTRINLYLLFDTTFGMYTRQYNNLFKETEKHKLNSFGYNSKKFMNCYRLLDLIERYYKSDFKDYEHSLKYDNKERETLLLLKSDYYTNEEVKMILSEKKSKIKKIEEIYKNFQTDKNIFKELNSLTEELFYNYLKFIY